MPSPLYNTLPGALAITGCPNLPAMPMPLRLVDSLKVVSTLPLAGQPQATFSSSSALAAGLSSGCGSIFATDGNTGGIIEGATAGLAGGGSCPDNWASA